MAAAETTSVVLSYIYYGHELILICLQLGRVSSIRAASASHLKIQPKKAWQHVLKDTAANDS
jgi:hypothetical protein